MDQYHSNTMSASNPPYSSLPVISPQQLQHHNPNLPQTLPPLQAPGMHIYANSAPHTPRTPATPNTPGSANTLNSFPQMGGQRGYQMIPTTTYQQQPPQYRASSSMMPQASTAMSHPQPIAPAPMQSRVPQTLRPMPPNGLQHMQSVMTSYGQPNMLSHPGMLDNLEPPTHVVGSQGRRGILPSAPGRPAVTATGTGSTKNTMIPAKDADGKFPCPHCTKTYLHAKHLKRHLLRHTGDRPYMCVLCRDTFSRSDILKRHFQKCSIRRGNPTGASHLSHAQAHLKKSHPGPHKPATTMSNENDLMAANGMGGMTDPGMHPFGVIPDGSMNDTGLTEEQVDQLSRSNSLKRLGNGTGRDGRNMAVPQGGFNPSYPGGIASTMPSGMNPSHAFSMPNGQNGHSYSQNYDFAGNGTTPQPQSVADLQSLSNGRVTTMSVCSPSSAGETQIWSQVFQPTSHEAFMNTYAIKHDSSPTTLFPTVYPAHGLPVTSDFPNWNFQNDPLEQISNRLIFYCFPPSTPISPRGNETKKYLSADNIKHFLEHFSSFQGHFPIIHMPSFRIADAYEGLLLALICIGAVYSERIKPGQVREMMEVAKAAIERNSEAYAIVLHEKDGGGFNEPIASDNSTLEQTTAIYLMLIIFIWHGTPIQREKARREFPLVVALARKARLTQPMTIPPLSALHQPNVSVEHFNAASFDWSAWMEQEKRSRLLFAIFLLDSVMGLYFNTEPLLDSYEIKIPLPADDAAWDAKSSVECAEALGLHGPVAARDRNPNGTRRSKQPEMNNALRALMHNVYDLSPGTTNLYSKFILVHGLHVQLWFAQKNIANEFAQAVPQALSYPSSGTSTPMSQNDWVIRSVDTPGGGATSRSTSGHGTPVEADAQQQLARVHAAFDKWKKVWDRDMAAQYPPASSGFRRFGFCRDGAPFYYLAKYLMQNAYDVRAAPDQRFGQIMSLIKSAKNHVVPDSVKRGENLGSVSDIDKDYGVSNLILDMAQLFKPLKQDDSPVVGVHTNIGGSMA